MSRSDLNDERVNGSYVQLHGPDPESWARWKLKLRRHGESGHGCDKPRDDPRERRYMLNRCSLLVVCQSRSLNLNRVDIAGCGLSLDD